jgi:hypothetical protein
MPHTISQGSRPDIMIMDIIESVDHDDMTASEPLGLNKGKRYVMLDLSKMSISLPENFLEGAKNSFFVHDNLVHLSIHVTSHTLRVIANMVAKLTRNPGKLSLHDSREAALAHLENLPRV